MGIRAQIDKENEEFDKCYTSIVNQNTQLERAMGRMLKKIYERLGDIEQILWSTE